MYLKQDIYSVFGNQVYGRAGDKVEIVGDHDNVMIVKDSKGFRFPVKTELLTSTNEGCVSQERPEPTKLASKVLRKKSVTKSQSLF